MTLFTKEDCADLKNRTIMKRYRGHEDDAPTVAVIEKVDGSFLCLGYGALSQCSVGMNFDKPRTMEDLAAEIDAILAEPVPEDVEISDTPENRLLYKQRLKELQEE